MVNRRTSIVALYRSMKGGTVEIDLFDAAGPDSNISLNSSALFYRINGGEWKGLEYLKSVERARKVLESCDDIFDAVDRLEKWRPYD